MTEETYATYAPVSAPVVPVYAAGYAAYTRKGSTRPYYSMGGIGRLLDLLPLLAMDFYYEHKNIALDQVLRRFLRHPCPRSPAGPAAAGAGSTASTPLPDMPLVLPQPLLLMDQKEPTMSIPMDPLQFYGAYCCRGLDMDPNASAINASPLREATNASTRALPPIRPDRGEQVHKHNRLLREYMKQLALLLMPVPEVVVDKCRIDCLSDKKVEPLLSGTLIPLRA